MNRAPPWTIATKDIKHLGINIIRNVQPRDFPGGAVVKNPPANAGDVG